MAGEHNLPASLRQPSSFFLSRPNPPLVDFISQLFPRKHHIAQHHTTPTSQVYHLHHFKMAKQKQNKVRSHILHWQSENLELTKTRKRARARSPPRPSIRSKSLERSDRNARRTSKTPRTSTVEKLLDGTPRANATRSPATSAAASTGLSTARSTASGTSR